MSNSSRISELAAIIASNTATVDKYFVDNGLPTPSLACDAPWNLPISDDATEVKAARLAVMDATAELNDLMTSPKELLNFNGFSLANNSEKNMYEIFADDPARGERFAMFFNEVNEPAHLLLDNYPWETVKTLVDVGGSYGSVAISIAEKFPNVKCIVQDLPEVVEKGRSRLPEKLKDRVLFIAYDFFTEQVVSADVYYFQSIFHNWSDKYCIRILRNMIPALKNGARIIIHKRVLPDTNTLPTATAKKVLNSDIIMLQLLNARQREMYEWEELFEQADARFHYVGAKQPPGSTKWIIEAEWRA